MDKLALISGESFVYWNSIVYTLAAATAICFFLAFYLGKCGNAVAGFAVIPMSIFLGLVAARFFHWYCRADSYDGFLAAMTDYTSGGYALMGVFLGCFLSAGLLRLVRLSRSLPEMLDAMALSGCAGIAVGRLSSLFNASDRGQVLEHFKSLPFAWPVTNAVSGAVEYRLATFMLQSMAALLLFAGLTAFYLRGQKKGNLKDGDTSLIFLLIYGASQVVLDSTRYDSNPASVGDALCSRISARASFVASLTSAIHSSRDLMVLRMAAIRLLADLISRLRLPILVSMPLRSIAETAAPM